MDSVPRRKLATYGKVSRKRIFDYQRPSSADPNWDLDDLADDNDSSRRINPRKHSENDGPGSVKGQNGDKASPRKQLQSPRKNKLPQKDIQSSWEEANTGKGPEVFDMPSSDEDVSQGSHSQGRKPLTQWPGHGKKELSKSLSNGTMPHITSNKTSNILTKGRTSSPPKKRKVSPADGHSKGHAKSTNVAASTTFGGELPNPNPTSLSRARVVSNGENAKPDPPAKRTIKADVGKINNRSPARQQNTRYIGRTNNESSYNAEANGHLLSQTGQEAAKSVPRESRRIRHTTPPLQEMVDEIPNLSTLQSTPSALKFDTLKLTPSTVHSDDDLTFKPAALNEASLPSPRPSPEGGQTKKPRKRLIDSLTRSPQIEDDSSDVLDEQTVEDSSRACSASSVRHPDAMEDVAYSTSSQEPTQSSSQSSVIPQQGGPKITYAKSRSYLSESMLDETALLNMPLDTGLDSSQSSFSKQGQRRLAAEVRSKPKDDLDLDSEEDLPSNKLKSIHELRQAGGNKRFLDESESILEEIEDRRNSSMSSRRTAIFKIGLKLTKKSYAQQFLDRGLENRLFSGLQLEKDLVSGFGLACIIVILAQHGIGNHSLCQIRDEGAATFLCRLLDTADSIRSVVKDRRTNLSRSAQSIVIDFERAFHDFTTPLDFHGYDLSPRNAALLSLNVVLKATVEASALDDSILSSVVEKLVDILARIPDDEFATPDSNTMKDFELAIPILEACISGTDVISRPVVKKRLSSVSIVGLLPALHGSSIAELRELQTPTLRLLLNLTNKDHDIRSKIGNVQLIESLVDIIESGFDTVSTTSDDTLRMASVDHLVLALATLTNISEGSDTIQQVHWAQGSSSLPVLDRLLKVFVGGLDKVSEADSMEATQFNVAFGYLAVLFSVLCLQNDVRAHVSSRLPGKTLRTLISAVEEFLQYHQRVDEQIRREGQGTEAQDGFQERLQANLETLQRVGEKDGK